MNCRSGHEKGCAISVSHSFGCISCHGVFVAGTAVVGGAAGAVAAAVAVGGADAGLPGMPFQNA